MTDFKRNLKISEDHSQITLSDSRFYRRNKNYYPSITHVLGSYPKGKHFEDWLMKVGYSSKFIVKKAADDGNLVHGLIEDFLGGKELLYLDHKGAPKYSTLVWNMVMRFVEFWETYKPELLEAEVYLFSDEIKVAGTCDLVCKIDGKVWIIDFKTSNYLHTSYELQTAIYRKCYEECFGVKIDEVGILWLKSSKRKFNKEKMQGKGWEMFQSSRSYEDNLKIFKNVLDIYKIENPYEKPIFSTLPTSLKLK
jgi:hypothetical protein